MNAGENWNGKQSSDRGLTEIAILLTLLIFVAFGFVFYFFYQKVTELSEQVEHLQQQVGELGEAPPRLEKTEETGEIRPVYVEKWAPPGSSGHVENKVSGSKDTSQGQGGDSFKSAPSVAPKEVTTVSVRSDGTIIDAPKSTGTNKAVEKPGLAEKTSAGQVKRNNVANETIIGDIKVQLKQCELKRLFLYCDLRIRSSTEVVRDIQIANKGSFVSGEDGAVYRVSSFRIGAMGDRQNYRSKATISRSLPLDVQFAFYLPSYDNFDLKRVQFNIAGNTFVFSNTALAQRPKSDGQTALARRPVPVVSPTSIQSRTIGELQVDLLECGTDLGKLYCDVSATNVGAQYKSMMIEHNGQFARDRKNRTYRSTSFAFAGSQLKHRTRTTVRAKRGVPRKIRFWFNGQPSENELHLVHFNLARTIFIFEYPKIEGDGNVEVVAQKTLVRSTNTSSKPKHRTTDEAGETRSVNGPTAKRVQTIDNILVELKHCAERPMYLYCDLNLNYLGLWGQDIVISKDNSFVRTPENASYRVTSFSVGTSGQKTHHQTKTRLQTGQSVTVRFRLYDPPSGIPQYETMQFNIDGQKYVFEDVRVGS